MARGLTRGKVFVYRDKAGEFRWRFVVNGHIMADSAEGYRRRRSAWRAWDRFVGYIRRGRYQTQNQLLEKLIKANAALLRAARREAKRMDQ